MTNLFLIVSALLAAGGGGSGIGPDIGSRMDMRDRVQGPTPVTGMYLIPPKVPDCRTQAEVDSAIAARRLGDAEKCDTVRFLRGR